MRVISGSLKGRKLASVRGAAIRPTADRVREALFNILGSRPHEANVLDLFAGTGALGIEALSRGARQALFLDHAAAAVKLLRKNIEMCRLETRCHVVQWNIAKNLHVLASYPQVFDLVFMDPPYDRGMIMPALLHLVESGSLAPEALIVAEHAPCERIEPLPGHLAFGDRRRYGQTQLTFFFLDG